MNNEHCARVNSKEVYQPVLAVPGWLSLQWGRKEISFGGAEHNLLNLLCQQYVQHLKHTLLKTQSYYR